MGPVQRALSWCAAAAVLAGLAGCYGTTEPATEVTQDSARLNARGTANNGQAYSYFQYGKPPEGLAYSTPTRTWPAGTANVYDAR